MDWVEIKSFAAELSLTKDALHIYAALAIHVVACLVFRRSLASALPWMAVLTLELVNEGLDLLLEPEEYIHEWQIKGSVHDVVNTMALPTILLLLVRHAPRLFNRRADRHVPEDPASDESH
jgi:hypothetical protein